MTELFHRVRWTNLARALALLLTLVLVFFALRGKDRDPALPPTLTEPPATVAEEGAVEDARGVEDDPARGTDALGVEDELADAPASDAERADARRRAAAKKAARRRATKRAAARRAAQRRRTAARQKAAGDATARRDAASGTGPATLAAPAPALPAGAEFRP